MKKFIVAILAVLYLGTSVGATVHLHYCMDKLANWSLWPKKGDNCNKCGMSKSEKKSSGCCKDEQKRVKVENDQKATESYHMLQLNSVAISVAFVELPAIHLPSVTEKSPLSHGPPRSGTIARYICNCVFRI
jgi:hypothetical protein